MNELDTLRPEVAHSVRCCDAEPYSDGAITHWPVVRAELLRLATIEADALIALDCEHDWQVEHKRAEKAEAELLELAEALHLADGVAKLAMQHRDAAEAELAALRSMLHAVASSDVADNIIKLFGE